MIQQSEAPFDFHSRLKVQICSHYQTKIYSIVMREKGNTLTAQVQPQEKSSSSSDESKSPGAESPKGTGRAGGKNKRTSKKVSSRVFSELMVPKFIVC